MATNIDPNRDSKQLENDNFAYQGNGSDLTKVVRRVEDEEALAVLQDILTQLGGASGTPFFTETQTTTTGVLQTLISTTVPALTTRSLSKIVIVCSRSAKIDIKINAAVVGSLRTGAANKNVEFKFEPARDAAAGDTITVEFTQFGGPTGVDVEAYLMATDA